MSAVPPLRYAGVHVERDRLNEHRRRVPLDTPEVSLRLLTPKGAAREIPLNEGDLIDLVIHAGEALAALRMERP